MLYMLIAILFVGFSASATDLNIDLKPENETLKTKRISDKKAKINIIEAAFPFKSTERKSFTAKVKLDINAWNHYGSITLGFRNSKYDDIFSTTFAKGDDAKRSNSMKVKLARGTEFNGRPFIVDNKIDAMEFVYKYDQQLNKFMMIILADGEEIYKSKWQKLRGYFSVDEFFISANVSDKTKPGSSIAWDKEDQSISVVSHVGNEGHYKYMIELFVSKVTIKQD